MKTHINLQMNEKFLDKKYCEKCAGEIICENSWTHVSQDDLAKEIYGHAFVYYKWVFLKRLPIAKEKIYEHTVDGIDIENKTDRFQFAWNVIWRL